MSKLITAIIIVLLSIFFVPLMCMLAWNSWAWQFNLPQFGYWHWVVTVLAIRGLFGARKVSTQEE